MIPDPVAAIVALLRDDADVAALVGTRVFGVELPSSEAPSMPRAAVVISGSGGSGIGAGSYVPIGQPRMDVRCYGATHADAAELHWTVYERLKHIAGEVYGQVLIYSASVESSAMYLRDEDWPLVLSVWRPMVSERVVA